MELARTLHMTLRDLFERADSRELGLWIALYRIEAGEQNLRDLAAKADAALRNR